jgi:hypothetical protein
MTDLALDYVLPHEAWNAVLDAVDEKYKAEDAEARGNEAHAASGSTRLTRFARSSRVLR